MKVVDFDGVTYNISTPESKNVLHISLQWGCYQELVSHGATDVLQREYGDFLASTPEPNYDVTLVIDLDKAPTDAGMLWWKGIERHITMVAKIRIRWSRCPYSEGIFVKAQSLGSTL